MTAGLFEAAWLVDMDGTLVDTQDANFSAYAQALAEIGVAVTRAEFDAQAFGRNWRQFLPEFLRRAHEPRNAEAVAARKATLYRDACIHLRFNEALVQLIGQRAKATAAALVTSASRANVEAVLQVRPDVRALFNLVITGDDVRLHKPHPEAYWLAIDRLQLRPEQCLVFEDSDIGEQAGLAAGARVLRVQI